MQQFYMSKPSSGGQLGEFEELLNKELIENLTMAVSSLLRNDSISLQLLKAKSEYVKVLANNFVIFKKELSVVVPTIIVIRQLLCSEEAI